MDLEQIIFAELGKRRPYGFGDEITRDTDLGDLRLDVLDEVEVIMEIEERLRVELPGEWPKRLATAGELVDWMREQTERQAA